MTKTAADMDAAIMMNQKHPAKDLVLLLELPPKKNHP